MEFSACLKRLKLLLRNEHIGSGWNTPRQSDISLFVSLLASVRFCQRMMTGEVTT